MSPALGIDSWRLERATDRDVDELMTWFDGERSVGVWGGPNFRYPFDRTSFVEDCHLQDMATFCLRNQEDLMCAFGQVYERNNRINLARLIAHPAMRGQGLGRRLVEMLMMIGAGLFELEEFSLFVYRDNTPALECYRSLGFTVQDYPPDESMEDLCYYLTRPADLPTRITTTT